MKKIIGLFCGLLFMLVSCSKDNDATITKVVTVASETRLVLGGEGALDAYLIKEDDATNWKFLTQSIDGFSFNKGHECRLRVEITKNSNCPDHLQGEWYDELWKCSEIISDTQRNSDAMPGHSDEAYIMNGYKLYKIEFLTSDGKNLLDSLGVVPNGSSWQVEDLFDIQVRRQSDEFKFASENMDYWLAEKEQNGTVLSVCFIDDKSLSSKDEQDYVYVTTIKGKAGLSTIVHSIKWYVRGRNVYKCEIDGEAYSLSDESFLDETEANGTRHLYAFIRI